MTRRTETTTLTLGPIALPLSDKMAEAVQRFTESAERRGYALLRAETNGQLVLSATKTTEVTQPYPRRGARERAETTR